MRFVSWIRANWNWPTTWGWDYPLVAMSAALLGQPARAVDALLLDTPKNTWRPNGHNHQRPGLTIYLPGNGALLYAVAAFLYRGFASPAVFVNFLTDNAFLGVAAVGMTFVLIIAGIDLSIGSIMAQVRDLGLDAIREYTEVKNVYVDLRDAE